MEVELREFDGDTCTRIFWCSVDSLKRTDFLPLEWSAEKGTA